jgi:glycine hydroxymethyltransferase
MSDNQFIYNFFNNSLSQSDSFVSNSIENEITRQCDGIELIASENVVSKAVLEAQGSVLTNKYAEGYSGKRYYGGCENMDHIESEAINRLKKIFDCNFANVQPHSGASANQSVFFAFAKPNDTIMGLDLACGGHLTHGSPVTQSGQWFNSISYKIDENGLLNYDEIEELALKNKPKLLIAGISSYPRVVNWKRFREIANKVNELRAKDFNKSIEELDPQTEKCIFFVDMAHIAGLVAGGSYPSPVPFADVVTSTTHKTLRGPRGGIILSNNEDIAKRINFAVFPGMQGGPLMHAIAAKCVSFGEALKDDFKKYAYDVIDNAKAMANSLIERGLKITTGGTDCHLIVVDLTPYGEVTGKMAEKALERAGITCNKNAIPFDKRSPFVTSGIRLGSPAGTSRGFGVNEFKQIGYFIADVLEGVRDNGADNNQKIENKIKQDVLSMCKKFPMYK